MIRLIPVLACLVASLAAQVIDYPWPTEVPQSDKYQVRIIQGGTATTMTTLLSEPYQVAGPDGTGLAGFLAGRTLSYLPFAFTGQVEVEVTKLFGTAAPRVEISPKSYGLEPHFFDGTTVRFFLTNQPDRPEYISVNFVTADNLDANGAGNDIKHGLMLFGDSPETDIPAQSGSGTVVYSPSLTTNQLATADLIYFPPGFHDLTLRYTDNPFLGVLPVGKNGQQVYLAGGAFIRGAIHGKGKDNVKVFGHGIISGHEMVWHAIRDEAGDKDGFMNFTGSDDCVFEGFTIVNPTHHTLPCSNRNIYRQFKIIGWTWNSDGVRPGSGSLFEEIFIKTMDDYDYARDKHTGRNSVIWPMQNGAFGQLGWNNLGSGNTTYQNISFINAEWASYNRNRGIIGSVLNQGVDLSNNLIEDLTVENNAILLANITIERDANEPFNTARPGLIQNFTFRNIIFEKPFLAPNGSLVKNPIHGFTYNGATAMVKDIRFINLVLGNTLVTQANHAQFFDIDPATTSNITFTTEGTIHTVTAIAGAGGILSPGGSLPSPDGMTRTITAIPDPGMKIKRVIIDGTDVGRLQNITFANISADHTISVEFENGSDYFDKTIVPTTPAGLAATPASSSSITLEWVDTSTNEISFELQRSPDGSTGWDTIQSTPANTASYTNTGLSSDTTYFYRIRSVASAADSGWSATATATTLAPLPAVILLGNTSNDTITSIVSSAQYALDSTGLLTNPGTTMETSSGIPWRFTTGQNLGTTIAGGFSVAFTSYQDINPSNGSGTTPTGGYNSITSNTVGLGIPNGANGNFIGNEAGTDGEEGMIFGLDASGLSGLFTLQIKCITLNQLGSNPFEGSDSAGIVSRLGDNPSLTETLGSAANPVSSVTVHVESLGLTATGGTSVPELFTVFNATDGSQRGFRIQSMEIQIIQAAPPVPADITLSDLLQTYDGTPRSATATTHPAALNVAFSYQSPTYPASASAPTSAGSYSVTATVTSPGYTGSSNGTLVIGKAEAVISVDNISVIHDGSPVYASANTDPVDLNVEFTYSGSPSPPVNIGTYTVVGTVNDRNYQGSASGTLEIVPSSSYASWSEENAGGQHPGGDFDHDGVPNGIEYFMGATGSSFTPNPPVQNRTITWPKDPLAQTNYEVQFSSTLTDQGGPQDWGAAPAGAILDDGTSVTVTLPETSGRLFVRLVVEVP